MVRAVPGPPPAETVFRALGPRGVACSAPRTGKQAVLVRTDQWLGATTAKVTFADS
jgi:hypothetical protein